MEKLNTRHRALMRELVSGKSRSEAAEAVGITPQRVTQLMNDQLFRSELERMEKGVEEVFIEAEGEKQVVERLRGMIEDSAEEILAGQIGLALQAESEAVRSSAGKDLLDRVGLKPVQVYEERKTIVLGEGVAQMIQRAMQDGEVIDAEYKNVSDSNSESNGDVVGDGTAVALLEGQAAG